MYIGGHLVKFFSVGKTHPDFPGTVFHNSTLGDFLGDHLHLGYGAKPKELRLACRRLEEEGYLDLISVSDTTPGLPPLHIKYMSYSYEEDLASYGVYDFVALGFPYIRQHFIESVRPIYATTELGKETNGTGFLLENRKFVTARHCIQDMKMVQIPGWEPDNVPLLNIWTHKDERVDLAVLEFDGDPFLNIPGFRLQEGQVLEDILTMGYPPIQGFDSVLVAETAKIAGYLQSTTGEIIGQEQSYLDRQTYLLITARVKGGNSGGPVINSEGMVCGIVAQLPADENGADTLGYAVVIPITTLKHILGNCSNSSEHVQSLRFTLAEDGFKTSR